MQSRWYAWAPQHVLPGGVQGPQEVCGDNAYIDRFTVSMGSAVVNANTTRAYRITGMLSVQGRCSNGKELGYYGSTSSEVTSQFTLKNIQVTRPPA